MRRNEITRTQRSSFTGEGIDMQQTTRAVFAHNIRGLVAAGLAIAVLSACGGGGGGGNVSDPNVVGQTQAAATTAITGAGLSVGTVTTQASATVTSGSVISQSPAAGT